MIYNPYFEKHGIDAVVVPMGITLGELRRLPAAPLPALEHPRRAHHHAAQGHDRRPPRRGDDHGARWRAPATPSGSTPRAGSWATCSTARASCAASLRKGRKLEGARALVRGRGRRRLGHRRLARPGGRRAARPLRRPRARWWRGSPSRLRRHYPGARGGDGLERSRGLRHRGQRDAARHEAGRPAAGRRRAHRPRAFVGEVVMKPEITPFLAAARARGCSYQVGTDMLFEQIPAYLEFFGLPDHHGRGAARGGADRLLRSWTNPSRSSSSSRWRPSSSDCPRAACPPWRPSASRCSRS